MSLHLGNSKRRFFCTYTDHRYLARMLVLNDSLIRHCSVYTLFVLCLSDLAYDVVVKMQPPNVVAIPLPALESFDIDFLATKSRRTPIEYYFGITASFPRFVLYFYEHIDIITFLDADLCFYASPEIVFEEIGSADIAIIGHRFSGRHLGSTAYGIYNVGWISWRNSEQGNECLSHYRAMCLEWCHDIEEASRFADQKYLDDWPARFKNLCIINHIGCNVAPWNVEEKEFRADGDMVFINDCPLIFYHFHSARDVIAGGKLSLKEYILDEESFDTKKLYEIIYKKYTEDVRQMQIEVDMYLAEEVDTTPLQRGQEKRLAASFSRPWRYEVDWQPLPPPTRAISDRQSRQINDTHSRHRYLAPPRLNYRFNYAVDSEGTALEIMISHLRFASRSSLTIVDWGFCRHPSGTIGRLIDAFGDFIVAVKYVLPGVCMRASYTDRVPNQVYPSIKCIDRDDSLLLMVGSHLALHKNVQEAFLPVLQVKDGWIVLDVRTFDGYPTNMCNFRFLGSPVRASKWIYNRQELMMGLSAMGLEVIREHLFNEPIYIDGFAEPTSRRFLLLSKINFD